MYPNSREDAVLEKLTYYIIYIKGGIIRGIGHIIQYKDIEGSPLLHTHSLSEVAENFGKTHSHVLRDLDKIISENPGLGSQIILSSYKTEGNNKTYKEYLLTEIRKLRLEFSDNTKFL